MLSKTFFFFLELTCLILSFLKALNEKEYLYKYLCCYLTFKENKSKNLNSV